MDKRVIVTRPVIGFAHMQVCAVADATDEEILSVCNSENPSGTSHGWTGVIREEGVQGPIQCATDPKRTHFLVSC